MPKSIRCLAGMLVVMASGLFIAVGMPAQASAVNRATVVVDTGQGVFTRSITFESETVTGIHALELAGAQPVVWIYAAQGGAVCRLFGVGRDSGPGCLGGDGGDARYWAYHRAVSGAVKFTYSQVGAGSTTVQDGDIEGWKFGLGSAPALPALQPPTTVPVIAATTPATAPPKSTGVITRQTAEGATTADPREASVATLPITNAPSKHADPRTGDLRSAQLRDGTRRATPFVNRNDDGSTASSLLLFGVCVVVLGATIVGMRWRRRRVR